MSKYYNGKNTKIEEIMTKYEHYGYMNWADLKAFRDYRDEINAELNRKDFMLKHGYIGLTAEHYSYLEAEVEEINYLNKYKIYNSTLTSLAEMNGVLFNMWDKEFSGYSNNAFFDFKQLCDMINCYWDIENPYKPSNKIAYGWKFSMKKAEGNQGYYSKTWRLYMWGCIKNYLIKNGIDFTKDESLKVRKIVGLVDIYDTVE